MVSSLILEHAVAVQGMYTLCGKVKLLYAFVSQKSAGLSAPPPEMQVPEDISTQVHPVASPSSENPEATFPAQTKSISVNRAVVTALYANSSCQFFFWVGSSAFNMRSATRNSGSEAQDMMKPLPPIHSST